MNQCDKCKFYYWLTQDKTIGECRIHAPTVLDTAGNGRWPKVECDAGCGDWEKNMTHEDYVREACEHDWKIRRSTIDSTSRLYCWKCGLGAA